MSVEAAYLAGIIDGEGTITITCQKQYKRDDYHLRPWVTVSNTDRTLIRTLIERHGGKSGIRTYQRANQQDDELYWRVMSQSEVQRILTLCLPYLVVKQKQAELVLEFVTSRLASSTKRYTDREMSLYEQVRMLNL